jgi:hypothetical protein
MSSSNQQKSGLWEHGLLLTLLFGFTVMIAGGDDVSGRAPVPDCVTGPDGATLFRAADIQQGQDLFRKRGLMDYGSVLGHGGYLGPDYTAEALHWTREAMRRERAPAHDALGVGQKAALDAEIAQELKINRYAGGTLRFASGQVAGWNVTVPLLPAGRQRAVGAGAAEGRAAASSGRRRRSGSRSRGGEAAGGVRNLDGLALGDQAARNRALLHQQLAV